MEYLVVNGRELVGKVPFVRDDFWPNGEFTEQDYVKLLHMSETYFKNISQKKVSIDDKRYYIQAPQSYLDIGKANHIDFITDDKPIINAYSVYIAESVSVRRCNGGYEYGGINGRHRFVTAKKYGLDLLVCVTD